MVQFSLDTRRLREFATLRDLGPTKLREIRDALKGAGATLETDDLERAIQPTLPGNVPVENVLRPLFLLYAAKRKGRADATEVLVRLREALAKPAKDAEPWNAQELAKWDGVQEVLIELMNLANMALVAKALDISVQYDRILQETRITSEVRPLYDDSGTSIEGAIIFFTLSLEYDTLSETKRVSVTADKQDIERLRTECERALLKGTAAKRSLNERLMKPIMFTGDQPDAGS